MDRYQIALGKKPEPKPVEPIRPTEATESFSTPFSRLQFTQEDIQALYPWVTVSHWKVPCPPVSCPICDEETPIEQEKPKSSAEEKNVYNKMSYRKYQKNLPKFLK